MEICHWFLGLDWATAFECFFKVVGALVAWLLVVTGWAVANDLSAQRDSKKSQESKIDGLRKRLEEVEQLALEHHTGDFDQRRAQKIVRSIKLIGIECSHLERIGVFGREWRAANNAVRRAVTLDNFDSDQHKVLSPSASVISGIEAALDGFQGYLLRSLEVKLAETEPLRQTLRRMWRRF